MSGVNQLSVRSGKLVGQPQLNCSADCSQIYAAVGADGVWHIEKRANKLVCFKDGSCSAGGKPSGDELRC